MAPDDTTCSICITAFKDPVITLPCNHKFCSICLEGWRSKYGSKRTCPQCRSRIPPTKEMISQVKAQEALLVALRQQLNSPVDIPLPAIDGNSHVDNCLVHIPSDDVRHSIHEMDPEEQQAALQMLLHNQIQQMETNLSEMKEQVDGFEELLNTEDDACEQLPMEICLAAAKNDVFGVFKWLLGPDATLSVPFTGIGRDCDIPKAKLNAKNPDKMDRTLLHEAEFEGNVGLMTLLLQCGANVDPKSSFGSTPLFQATCYQTLDQAARLLLEWGADTSEQEVLVGNAESAGNQKLAHLMKTPLGGRRCQIVGLQGRKDLNGTTGIVGKYFPVQDRYAVVLEQVNESVKVRPTNLRRRDRTPTDPGKLTVFSGRKNGGNIFQSGVFVCQEFGDEETEWYRRLTQGDGEDQKTSSP